MYINVVVAIPFTSMATAQEIVCSFFALLGTISTVVDRN